MGRHGKKRAGSGEFGEEWAVSFTTLLVPFLLSALQLFVGGVADHQLIDKTWMIAKEAKSGPFGSIDQIGITTAYNITWNMAEQNEGSGAARVAACLKEHFTDTGKLGVAVGEASTPTPIQPIWRRAS
jgi:3-hydroxyacyl-CoA dehydrogenase